MGRAAGPRMQASALAGNNQSHRPCHSRTHRRGPPSQSAQREPDRHARRVTPPPLPAHAESHRTADARKRTGVLACIGGPGCTSKSRRAQRESQAGRHAWRLVTHAQRGTGPRRHASTPACASRRARQPQAAGRAREGGGGRGEGSAALDARARHRRHPRRNGYWVTFSSRPPSTPGSRPRLCPRASSNHSEPP
jgi:hypothetical protein